MPYILETQLYWFLFVRWIVQLRMRRLQGNSLDLFIERQARNGNILAPEPASPAETAVRKKLKLLFDREKELDEQILGLKKELGIKPEEAL